ncbi:MAG: Protein-export membrane protein SecF [Candidatus Methanofastidiosum methylothiophilum]|uniref:Protein-export membrane protein SecF n=1 Tax=Candidatus Methanofastidiosum methylothiophilum TaxID=1705564 RepID=A0A150JA96_9EURY|nr:MAG: Protein-export membrane protein SecF [Candidatus Methanofastidiosum methylthiophilus]NMC77634.1 protein translocase subunit SecF [Candidatus Methanofastidiosa archaeon]
MKAFEKIFDKIDVTKHDYKKLIFIPLGLVLIAIIILGTMGVNLGVDLRGGTLATVNGISYSPDIENYLITNLGDSTIKVRSIYSPIDEGFIVETGPDVDSSKLIGLINARYPDAAVSVQNVGPSLGASFLKQGTQAILLAFLFMAIVVFLAFRIPIPSVAVVFSAFSDMLIALAFMSIAGIELSRYTIAAILMLIGYSVDTDILLTTRVLKEKGDTVNQKVRNAMKTGLMMTFTTLAALSSLYLFSTSEVIDDIAIVLIFGLIADLMMTWIFNAGVLKWYALRRAGGELDE